MPKPVVAGTARYLEEMSLASWRMRASSSLRALAAASASPAPWASARRA